jgi:hypothetical protein
MAPVLMENAPFDSNLDMCTPEYMPIFLLQSWIPSLNRVLIGTWADHQLASSKSGKADNTPVEFDLWDMHIFIMFPCPSNPLNALRRFFLAANSGGYTYDSAAIRRHFLALCGVLSYQLPISRNGIIMMSLDILRGGGARCGALRELFEVGNSGAPVLHEYFNSSWWEWAKG